MVSPKSFFGSFKRKKQGAQQQEDATQAESAASASARPQQQPQPQPQPQPPPQPQQLQAGYRPQPNHSGPGPQSRPDATVRAAAPSSSRGGKSSGASMPAHFVVWPVELCASPLCLALTQRCMNLDVAVNRCESIHTHVLKLWVVAELAHSSRSGRPQRVILPSTEASRNAKKPKKRRPPLETKKVQPKPRMRKARAKPRNALKRRRVGWGLNSNQGWTAIW
eukprot:963259-Rhodomonas_salina.4